MYSARDDDGERLRFGSSGLLYRSNKLMFDRGTFSLWHNLTGEAAVGPQAAAGSRLKTLPVAVSTWGAWRSAHPETTVVSLSPAYGERWGFDYSPGAADRHRAGVRFPVWQRSARLERATEVLGVRIGGAAKAYPVDAIAAERVLNDSVGGATLVVVAEVEGGGLRVYRRGGHFFRLTKSGELADETGAVWRLSESALAPPPERVEAPLERLPAHHALWFGWFGFFPETEVYERPR